MSEGISILKRIRISGISIIFGLLLSVIFLSLSALLVSNISMPHGAFTIFSSISLILGGVGAGFMSGAVYKSNGLLHGIIEGVILFLIIFVVSLLVSGEIGMVSLFKLVMCIFSGMAGGIIGVNKK